MEYSLPPLTMSCSSFRTSTSQFFALSANASLKSLKRTRQESLGVTPASLFSSSAAAFSSRSQITREISAGNAESYSRKKSSAPTAFSPKRYGDSFLSSFSSEIPTNCCGFGRQPLASSPEPSTCARSDTYGVKLQQRVVFEKSRSAAAGISLQRALASTTNDDNNNNNNNNKATHIHSHRLGLQIAGRAYGPRSSRQPVRRERGHGADAQQGGGGQGAQGGRQETPQVLRVGTPESSAAPVLENPSFPFSIN
ncbi:hypothetical protein EYF80_039325 [Liparis tanakae]|uniref:Uncharacterized protein n=1 Tax=Liparis tanakae TaxID=230148 RepID=A0A4Z2GA43_9TELE|nr:hypothetical protein EYF80_039325 [Liparis tanakae]